MFTTFGALVIILLEIDTSHQTLDLICIRARCRVPARSLLQSKKALDSSS